MTEPRMSLQTLMVLQAFLDKPLGHLSGADLYNRIKISSGTLYPLLARLEKAGWLVSEWEQLDPREAARPRRRYYRMTALGERKANAALAQLGTTDRTIAESWA